MAPTHLNNSQVYSTQYSTGGRGGDDEAPPPFHLDQADVTINQARSTVNRGRTVQHTAK